MQTLRRLHLPRLLSKTLKMSSWSCSRCTFLNPPTQTSTCQICSTPSSSLQWSCRSCTFLNPASDRSCAMCTAPSQPSVVLVDDDDPAVGSVFMPLRKCGTKRKGVDQPSDSAVCGESAVSQNVLKVLSYNVWFREDMEVNKRMESLGNLIQQSSPDLICFQEVTPNIYRIFQEAAWWNDYKCSVSMKMAVERPYFCMQMIKLPVAEFTSKPFGNSIMGRELCIADVDCGMGKRLTLATSHLESPCPAPPKWDQMFVKERVAQAQESIMLLEDRPNTIFCGDMNWDEKLDGQFPLTEGWVDPWVDLHPGENGWTFDTKVNQMLSANRTLQKRLDRFNCKLQDFKILSIDMIGKEAIPGVTYVKEKKVKKEIKELVLPVYISDHFGLLLTIERL